MSVRWTPRRTAGQPGGWVETLRTTGPADPFHQDARAHKVTTVFRESPRSRSAVRLIIASGVVTGLTATVITVEVVEARTFG